MRNGWSSYECQGQGMKMSRTADEFANMIGRTFCNDLVMQVPHTNNNLEKKLE